MYVTDLRGLRIMSLMSALKMATVEDALLDPSCRYVAALSVREYGPGKRHYVLRKSIQRIGRHAVVLSGTDEMPAVSTLDDADRLINLGTLIRLEVVSDQGNLVGRIHNAVIDAGTLDIAAFEVTQPRLGARLALRGPLWVDAKETLSRSKDVLIVPEAILSASQALREMPSRVHWRSPEVYEGRDIAGAPMH